MVKKNKDKTMQVQAIAQPSDTNSSFDNSDPNGEDLSMKRRKLSRDSTLGSIQEEDSSSIDEKLMIESFKRITDIFENEAIEDAENKEIVEPLAVPKERARSTSEDTDSMDEEVRKIMSKGEAVRTSSKVGEKASFTFKEEEEISDTDESNEESIDEKTDSIMTETESESESEVPFSDSETEEGNETETSEADRYPIRYYHDEDETELSEEEEFDLEKYIDKLCLQSTDEESEIETTIDSDDTSTYSKDFKKTAKKMTKKRGSKRRSDDQDSRSVSDSSDDDNTTGSGSDHESNENSDDSSDVSSGESDIDYFYDDDDTDSSTTDTSQNEDFDVEERGPMDPNVSQMYNDELQSQANGHGIQPHDAVRQYYLGLDHDKCPVRLDVHESEIGRVSLDSTLSSGSVVSLRWPYSNYYVKELDLDNDETDNIFDEGLSPTYKSMQSSASFPGRRRNVLSGRVWWVEWWANSLSDIESSERSVEDLQAKDGDDECPEFEEIDDISLDESAHL